MSKPVVIYHEHCIDGFTAAWAAQRALGKCELVPASYGDEPPVDLVGRDVVIVDFSYPRETLLTIASRARSLAVLDHHASARDALADLPFAVFDLARSGAGLAWDHFHPGEPRPWLVDYVEDRDLWRWSLPWSREVSAWLRLQDLTLERWDELGEDRIKVRDDAAVIGRSLLLQVTRSVRRQAARASTGRIGEWTAPIVNASEFVSEVGNELALGAPFAIVWSQGSSGAFHYSLRSSAANPDHADVAMIARTFGGGGHRHAAGFESAAMLHLVEPQDPANPR